MRQWQRGTSNNKSSLWQVYLNTKGKAIIEMMLTLKHVCLCTDDYKQNVQDLGLKAVTHL